MNDKKLRVAIVYQNIAHYRLPVFHELMASPNIDFTLISDTIPTSGIKTINPDLASRKIDHGGLRWIFVKNKWFLGGKFLWQRGLIKNLIDNNFDKVIFLGNIYYLSTWVAIFYLKAKKKEIYLWTHGVTTDVKGFNWAIRKYFYNLSNGLLLYGNNAKKVMIKNGFTQHKLYVIYNSLDYDKQLKYRMRIDDKVVTRIKKNLFKHNSLPYIVFVGRLTRHKKLDMIVHATKILYDNNIKINTLFVGEGEIKPELNILIDNLGLQEYYKFYGPCYKEEELSQLIGSADICVSPGEVGLTAMTSLGYGTPVLTHGDFNNQMPEYEAITPGINGEFFKRDSIEDLANKIQQWIENNKGKSRDKIRRDCFEIIDLKYNPKNQAKLINEIILDS